MWWRVGAERSNPPADPPRCRGFVPLPPTANLPHATVMPDPSARALLVILDGWGLGPDPTVDAIAAARTPTYDGLLHDHPHATLVTYGEDVGLPAGQMGNSEVGHLNIGAGRVVYQELARINRAVREGTLAGERAIREAMAFAKTARPDGSPRALHLMGLVSDGGVHSHVDHLLALCDAAAAAGVERVFVHAFTDGRDTAPEGGVGYLETVLAHVADQPARLASVTGRYYAMDRDKRWERVRVAYDALVRGRGERTTDPLAVLRKRYGEGQTDEFVEPIVVVGDDGEPVGGVRDGDAVLFFNFRTDRPRQLTEALTQRAFPEEGMAPLTDLHYVTMTRYDEAFAGVDVVYAKDDLPETLGEVLATAGKTQLRIAETEKYPHVTFFFNGGREEAFAGEHRIIVPSPKVATYDLQPEMSALRLRDELTAYLREERPDFACVNFANTDMVGHTGVWEAAVRAAEVVDDCLGEVLRVAGEQGYDVVVIADHGNSDEMRKPDGSPHTAHTTNPVPVIYVPAPGREGAAGAIADGKLADVAPTLLALLGLGQPDVMDGRSLLPS